MKVVLSFFSFVLSRRYKIKVKGEHLLHESGAKLLLQNHQSHIDPQLLGVFVAQRSGLVPVISEKFLRIPVIGAVLRSHNAVSVSDLKHGNRDPNVLKNMISKIMEALEKGKSVLIAPSGNIAQGPVERIKNKQSAHALVSNLPDGVKVIGVRVNGLWGSMWSVAWMGKKPDFLKTFLKGIFYILANLIFFMPKREITFEFVDITEEAKLQSKSERKVFNHYLEEFYNINGPEEVTYLKHFFYAPKIKRTYPANLVKDK
ncbi:MAG: 1-acyl-sn-glycerol-3-phosphate acyltransferase [Fluviicola sp.]|nr:1-acyl-sn-glycerol-3-phosphate acyltransferase [Fluviicola sp.]